MSVLDERDDYLKNPYFDKREYGDFTPFYITITICTVFVAVLVIINIILGCCSKYSQYWNDPFTGNRWAIPLWTSTPHKQPPLDLTELDKNFLPPPVKQQDTTHTVHYQELRKVESDI